MVLADSTCLQSQIKTQDLRIDELVQEAATVRTQLQEVNYIPMQPVLTCASPHLALAVFEHRASQHTQRSGVEQFTLGF